MILLLSTMQILHLFVLLVILIKITFTKIQYQINYLKLLQTIKL